MVGVAQLVSAPDCGSGGRGFESLYPPYNGLSPSGKAQDFDSCTRGFESRWPSGKRLNFYYGNSAFFIFIEFIFYFLNHLQNAFPTMFHRIRAHVQIFLQI